MATPIGFAHFQITLQHSVDPEAWLTTIATSTDLANFSPTEHCDHVLAAFQGAFGGPVSDEVTMGPVRGFFGQDGDQDLIAVSTLDPLLGSNTNAMLPQNCAALVRKRTASAGRKNLGRMYLPGILREDLVSSSGKLTTTMQNNVQGAADGFLDAIEDDAGGTQPNVSAVILHGDGSTPTTIIALEADGTIATQRRRLR